MANNQISVSISASGDNVVIPAIPGQLIQVYGVVLSLDTETTVQFKSGTTALSGAQRMDSLVLDKTPGDPWYITARGEAFVISLGAAVQCGGTLYFQPV